VQLPLPKQKLLINEEEKWAAHHFSLTQSSNNYRIKAMKSILVTTLIILAAFCGFFSSLPVSWYDLDLAWGRNHSTWAVLLWALSPLAIVLVAAIEVYDRDAKVERLEKEVKELGLLLITRDAGISTLQHRLKKVEGGR
jgi:hypothetical protein